MIDIKAPTKFIITQVDGDLENSRTIVLDAAPNGTMYLREPGVDGRVLAFVPPGSGLDVVTLRLLTTDVSSKRRAA